MSTAQTGAQATVDVLSRHGVKQVFGLCGHTNLAVLAALEASPVRFLGVHHEQMASHAADGYARVTGEIPVVLTHLGPGLTNALTGVANATLDAVPMLVISGNVQSYFVGRHAHMESTLHGDANQAESFAPFCKRIWRVDRPEALVPALEAAFRTAASGIPGPVLVDVAMDVFSLPVEIDSDHATQIPPQSPGLDPAAAEQIAEAMLSAERPLLYLGGGVVRTHASAEARALAERLGAPVAYSLMGKGAMPDTHELVVGMSGLWGTPAANAACREADVILAVGTKFGELDTSSWQPGVTFSIPPTRLLHVHLDPSEIGRSYPVEVGAVAEERLALQAILASLGDRRGTAPFPQELREMVAEFRAEVKVAQTTRAFPLHPARVVADVASGLPVDAVLVGDTGWNKNGVGQQVMIDRAGRFISPGGYATMGFGPAAALGVAAAGMPVVALVGDGAFLANLSVVVTAVEERLPVVWAVMNNGTYATISGMQRRHFGSEYGSSFDSSAINYVAMAQSVGADGARVERADQIPELLGRALASRRPFVLDIPCSRENVPTTGSWDINDLFAQAAAAAVD
jgi:acetolactate synthase I/II/III large subunit